MTNDGLLAQVLNVVREAPRAELPALLGRLAEAEATARMRLAEAPAAATPAAAEDRLLTYDEVASMLQRSKSYVETIVRQGKLGAVRLPGTKPGREGRGRRIRLSALVALREG